MRSSVSTTVLAVFMASGPGLNQVFAQESQAVRQVKNQIVELAKSFEGQGDPDYSKQNALEPLVRKLLELAPQPPLKDRLKFLYGPWRQMWGCYDYRNDNRGVDPELGTGEIYQVVFEGGYYYNVSFLFKDGDPNQKRVGLLRGVFRVDETNPQLLRVKFTRYPGNETAIPGKQIWEMAALAEDGMLPNEISIVPTWIVRLFFRGGALREVYTDSDLRITYGSNGKDFDREYLYIMVRAH